MTQRTGNKAMLGYAVLLVVAAQLCGEKVSAADSDRSAGNESPLFDDSGGAKTPVKATASPQVPADLFEQEGTPAKTVTDASVPETRPPRGLGDLLSGKLGVEYRNFLQYGPEESQDYHNNVSLAFEPKLFYQWGKNSIGFTGFGRWDEHDSRRTHVDIREFIFKTDWDQWSAQVGIGKVFWGVTESRHTVDIINQTDFVENPDTERKLGQPMVNLNYRSDYGTLSLFLLPISRTRTFPGPDGRIRPAILLNDREPVYRGGAGTFHTDFAGRWSKTLGSMDLGIAYFRGTTREPLWQPVYHGSSRTPSELLPLYDVIQQTSIDSAWALGNWLLKFEGYHRNGQGPDYFQITSGFEYTFSGILDTGSDLGLLAEYLYDGRRNEYRVTPYNSAVFLGTRLGVNDTGSTEFVGGIFVDLDSSTLGYTAEASRRFGENWKLNFEARGFANTQPANIVAYLFRTENYFMLELERYF